VFLDQSVRVCWARVALDTIPDAKLVSQLVAIPVQIMQHRQKSQETVNQKAQKDTKRDNSGGNPVHMEKRWDCCGFRWTKMD
jgi:hypothetical protein